MQLGAEKMATGHFVQTNDAGQLLKGADPGKDQSYFLYMLHSGQLKKAIFPVGGMTKAQVRAIAEEAGLPVAKKKDSTGICFIGERQFKPFLKPVNVLMFPPLSASSLIDASCINQRFPRYRTILL